MITATHMTFFFLGMAAGLLIADFMMKHLACKEKNSADD